MVFLIKLLSICVLASEMIESLPRRHQRQLFRNDFYHGLLSGKHFTRGPKPPIKSLETSVLIPFSKWKSATKCEMKSNIYTLTAPKCQVKKVNRGLCYGQCSSVFIPGQNLHYSAACIPIMQQRPVEMECEGEDGTLAKRIMFYEKVVACQCKKVNVDWKQVVKEIRSQFEDNAYRKF